MKSYTSYAVMWIAVAIGVIFGLYFTKNANCLWAFLLPVMVGMPAKSE